MADASHTFTYGYLANPPLVETFTAGAVHTDTNTWEPDRDMLASMQNKVGSTVISQYDHTVNELGQRTHVDQAGTAFQGAGGVGGLLSEIQYPQFAICHPLFDGNGSEYLDSTQMGALRLTQMLIRE